MTKYKPIGITPKEKANQILESVMIGKVKNLLSMSMMEVRVFNLKTKHNGLQHKTGSI